MAEIRKESESKWIEWQDARILVRAYPIERLRDYSNDPKASAEQDWNIFNYSVKDWENITMDGEEAPCNTANKKYVYNYNLSLVKTIQEAMKSFYDVEEEIKN